MNPIFISIPHHDGIPLILTGCEAKWLERHNDKLEWDGRDLWIDTTDPQQLREWPGCVAAEYECALRNAVLAHFQKDGGWTIQVTHYERFNHFESDAPDLKSVLRVDVQCTYGADKEFTGEYPTELHAWREFAKLLEVGPWAKDQEVTT